MTERTLRELLDRAADDSGRSAISSETLVSHGRTLRRRRRATILVTAAAVATGAVLTWSQFDEEPSPDPVSSARTDGSEEASDPPQTLDPGSPLALCEIALTYDGVKYVGAPRGNPDRRPELTGEKVTAFATDCNDQGQQAEPSTRPVSAAEVVGLPVETALWWAGSLLVRQGVELPAFTDAWYQRPGCDPDGPRVVIGDWLGVKSTKKVRFDGDIRPPLRIQLHVRRSAPASDQYERYTIPIVDDGSARPALNKEAVEMALWSDQAQLRVGLRCEGRRFYAESFELVPG